MCSALPTDFLCIGFIYMYVLYLRILITKVHNYKECLCHHKSLVKEGHGLDECLPMKTNLFHKFHRHRTREPGSSLPMFAINIAS